MPRIRTCSNLTGKGGVASLVAYTRTLAVSTLAQRLKGRAASAAQREAPYAVSCVGMRGHAWLCPLRRLRPNRSTTRLSAREAGREVRFGLNGFIIARDTEKEAKEVLREIIDKANRPAVEGFRSAVQQAGNATLDKRGMWADSTFEDLVQYNDGFRTQLIGTPEQIAERVAAYRKRGVDLILGGFLHFQEEVEYFGAKVLPLVREIEDSEEDSVDSPVLVSA